MDSHDGIIQYGPGTLVYLLTFRGNIPAKLTKVQQNGLLEVTVTSSKNGYRKGEVISPNGFRVVPRTGINRNGDLTVDGRWMVPTAEAPPL